MAGTSAAYTGGAPEEVGTMMYSPGVRCAISSASRCTAEPSEHGRLTPLSSGASTGRSMSSPSKSSSTARPTSSSLGAPSHLSST